MDGYRKNHRGMKAVLLNKRPGTCVGVQSAGPNQPGGGSLSNLPH